MNEEKFLLPDFLLADLFKDSIVLIDNERDIKSTSPESKLAKDAEEIIAPVKQQAKISDKVKPLSFLGNNKKHISIVVNDDRAIHLQDDLLEILSAILAACKLNLADVSIINTHQQEVNDILLRKELSPSITLLFGVETTAIDLPFSIPLYKPQPFNNCTYLQSVSLDKMKGTSSEAKLEKSKLWVSLKSLFAV